MLSSLPLWKLYLITQPLLHNPRKLRRILTNNPMPTNHIPKLKPRKEIPNNRQRLIRNILALRAANKQRRLEKAVCLWIFVREIRHMIQRLCEDGQGNAET